MQQQDHYARSSYNHPSLPPANNDIIRKPRSSQPMHRHHHHHHLHPQHQHQHQCVHQNYEDQRIEDHRIIDNSNPTGSSNKQELPYIHLSARAFHSTAFDPKLGHLKLEDPHFRDERNPNPFGNLTPNAQWAGVVARGSRAMPASGEDRAYGEVDGRRAEVSGVSQSEGSDGYGEEDGDLEEEEEQELLRARDSEGDEADRGGDDLRRREYQTLADAQKASLESRHDASAASLRFPNSFQAGMVDRDRASKALPNNSLGIFLSTNPLACVDPFSSRSGVQNGVQNGQRSEGNGYENGGRELALREAVPCREVSSQVRAGSAMNYYTTLLHLPSGVGAHKGDSGNDSACSGDRSAHPPDQTLRMILSDHLSGALMDDATIFPCGHSFGNAGLQRVLQTNACIICGITVRPESGAPNYALRAAVHAFRQEQAQLSMDSWKSAKRKRDEQFTPSEHSSMEGGRPKGVQFPYVVNDRVLIKGNKRTPERFVGREAIITTQCLNGWYMVRTLDTGENVRLQYRSLEKIGEFG